MEELLLNLITGLTNMKRKLIYTMITFTISIFFQSESKGQIKGDILENERVNLFCDRTLYVVGEPILFTASVSAKDAKNNLSKVLYVELITPNGESVSRGKYLIENSKAEGSLFIPKETLSGYYFLKTYTKFLRNFGPNYYCYNSIKIVNPTSNELLSISNNSQIKFRKIGEESNQALSISLETNKERFATRDTVKIIIRDNSKNQQLKNLCLSVIPKGSLNEQNTIEESIAKQISVLTFYPETKGLSLSGKLIDSKNGTSIVNKKINLSIIGLKDHFTINTDSKGRFFFLLPNFVGVKDIYINSENTEDSKSSILIDNDFCQDRISLPSPTFQLLDDEKMLVYSLATNVQASSHFRPFVNAKPDSASTYTNPFYGEPSQILIFDNYIKLTNTEEYINELLPTVKLRKQRGSYTIKVLGNQPEMSIYSPLVLVDMVSISDLKKVLEIAPDKIDRIEIIAAPYMKGDAIYGGIISIISKNKDFAGIDLPVSGVFLNFTFWNKNYSMVNNQTLSKNQPDLRNTLFWESDIKFSEQGESIYSAKTSDMAGEYLVVLRGLKNDGQPFLLKTSFLVYK
jgi:hypothetical protein